MLAIYGKYNFVIWAGSYYEKFLKTTWKTLENTFWIYFNVSFIDFEQFVPVGIIFEGHLNHNIICKILQEIWWFSSMDKKLFSITFAIWFITFELVDEYIGVLMQRVYWYWYVHKYTTVFGYFVDIWVVVTFWSVIFF